MSESIHAHLSRAIPDPVNYRRGLTGCSVASMNALDKTADQLRREYCAFYGLTFFPAWDAIKLEKVREYWRKQARLPKAERDKPRPVERAERPARGRVTARQISATPAKVVRLRKRFPWAFTG